MYSSLFKPRSRWAASIADESKALSVTKATLAGGRVNLAEDWPLTVNFNTPFSDLGGWTLAHAAAHSGNTMVLWFLGATAAVARVTDDLGASPLMVACVTEVCICMDATLNHRYQSAE